MDDFVCDIERQPGEEIKESEPLRDAMLNANPPETVKRTKEDCSSKLVGELCTVSCVSGDSNSLDLPQIFLCESDESLLHIFGPENFTCVADVFLCTELGQLCCQ